MIIVNQANILCIWIQITYMVTMSQYLPYDEFKQSNKKEIDKFYVNSIIENSLDGYKLEFHLEYPDKLHELYNEYPIH